jgi:hypothetical protein
VSCRFAESPVPQEHDHHRRAAAAADDLRMNAVSSSPRARQWQSCGVTWISTPRRLLGAAGVLAVLTGTWVSHALIYALGQGPLGWPDALLRSLHLYMSPLGLALALLGAALTVRALDVWRTLERRLRVASVALRRSAPRRLAASTATPLDPPRGVATLAALLSVVQFSVYVIQENFERIAVSVPVPGAAVVAGRFAPVVIVHVVVALTLASGLVFLQHRLHRRERVVLARERLVSAIARRRVASLVHPLVARLWTPVERFGRCLWARPPPLLSS